MNGLKPVDRLLVYDLVREAEIDVSDWANYKKPTIPAANPKYCYDWAFEGTDRIVLCLWFDELHQDDGSGTVQLPNYREISSSRQHWNDTQRKRAAKVDRAIQLAKKNRLPVRVIVVDGSRRAENGDTASKVERRLLDPVPWSIVSYDEGGNCYLRRESVPGLTPEPPATDTAPGNSKLARIAYNSHGWQGPTGEAGEQESGETYNAINKFGHEDWLFRAEWIIDGWRYAFIQGLNKSRRAYLGQPLDVTLFTIEPDKRRRLVATINGVEALSDEQAKRAVDAFRTKGWLSTMEDEVRAIGGNPDSLGANGWAEHVLNVRYRLNNVDAYPPNTFLEEDDWIRARHRYMLYNLDADDRERIERTSFGRAGSQDTPDTARLFRRGTKSIEYTPEHNIMQAQLLRELQEQYGRKHVWLEKDYVDARVETTAELIYFEIKTDLDPRAVIRQALGQILEYAYHPLRSGRRPDSLVIVGRTELRTEEETYLGMLCEQFKLPLSYRVVAI